MNKEDNLSKIYKLKKKKTAFSLIELAIVILVISVALIIAFSKSNLVSVAELSNLRSITSKSPVYDIGDATIWLDVANNDAFASYPVYGDSIGSFIDTSPFVENNSIFSQGTAENQPTFLYDSVDDLPTLRFDGNDLLQSAAINSFDLSDINEATVFVVQRHNSGNNTIIGWNGSNSSNRVLVQATNGGALYWDFGNSTSNGRISATPANFNNEWKIITLVKRGASAGGIIRVNSTALTTSGTMTDALDFDSQALNIGDVSNVDLREIIIFRKELNNDEIIDVENYLSKKWQINID